MKRRTFLKKLGLLVAVPVAAQFVSVKPVEAEVVKERALTPEEEFKKLTQLMHVTQEIDNYEYRLCTKIALDAYEKSKWRKVPKHELWELPEVYKEVYDPPRIYVIYRSLGDRT